MKKLKEKISKSYKKAIVTGAAGFIGSHICEELVETGIEIIALDDLSAGKLKNVEFLNQYKNFHFYQVDVTDIESLDQHFSGVDLVFHNAASKKNVCLLDPRKDMLVNGIGTFNMLELSVKYGIRKFVHASTGSVYGEPFIFPQDENHPYIPVSYYGVSKLAGERYVALFNRTNLLNTTILRYFHVFGSRQESNEFGGVVSIFIKKLLNNERPIIFGDGTQLRSFTYVKDIVKANFLVATNENAIGKEFNCASGLQISVNELCAMLIDHFNLKGRITPKYEDWLIGDIKHFDVSNENIKKLGMGFSLNFDELLKSTVNEMIIYHNQI